MAKNRSCAKKIQNQRCLVVCEGATEKWYLSGILNPKKCRVKSAKKSNVSFVISEAQDEKNSEFNAIYCVFDRDSESNTIEQLKSANITINGTNSKLQRVFSSPCFEVVFLLSKGKDIALHDRCNQVEIQINKLFFSNDKNKYGKQKQDVNKLIELTNFEDICHNSRLKCKELQVNSNNWLSLYESYSEIFKLLDFKE